MYAAAPLLRTPVSMPGATGAELAVRPATPAVDPSDLELMRLNLTRSPEARLAGFFNLLQLRGLAVR